FGKAADEVMGLGPPGGFENLFLARIPAAVANVVQDALIEQLRLLRHQRDAATELLERDVVERDAVDEHVPFLRVEEPAEEVHQRAFATPIGADNRQMLAEGDLEIDVP